MDDATWREGSERLAPFLGERGKMARMPEGIRVWGERAARELPLQLAVEPEAPVRVDGKLLSDQLIAAGLARQYDGGKRRGWC